MSAALITGGWILGWLLLWRLPRLANSDRPSPGRSDEDASDPPAYAVIIPARNEAGNIAGLVSSIRASAQPPAELVVVDDSSEDDTARLAEQAGARVVPAGPLPAGWAGKNWACHRGVAETTAPVLVFLDADVRLTSGALGEVVASQARAGGWFSVAPWHTVERPYEWLSMLFGIVSIMGIGAGSPIRSRMRAAFGPCLAIDRVTYEGLGGHAAVRDEITEDLALAARAADAEVPITVVGGRPGVTYRMYANGVRPLVEGWSKNIATGARHIPVLRSVGTAIWVTGLLSALLGLASLQPLALAAAAAWVAQVGWMARQTGSFPLWSLVALPVLAPVFVLIFVRSMVLTAARRRVSWRGRDIPVPSRRHTLPAAVGEGLS